MLNTGEEVGICAINVTECLAGARPQERPGWEEVFRTLRYWPIQRADAALAGTWGYDFARRGRALTTGDLLIAAVARRLRAVVVTDNVKDFPMEDIVVQSLR
jgi:predicted nucleic acid-binding protein